MKTFHSNHFDECLCDIFDYHMNIINCFHEIFVTNQLCD